MKKQVIFLSLMALVLLFALAACGQKEESKKAEEKTKTVDTVKGKVEIPANPKRILVDGYLGSAIALGVKPVGATTQDLKNIHLKGKVDGVTDISDERSAEKVASLKPDLIISAVDDEKVLDVYRKVAPTIVYPFGVFKDSQEEITTLAGILNKEEEGKAFLKKFNQRMEAARKKVKTVIKEGETVSILGAFRNDVYVYGNGIYRGGQALYEQLQLQPPKEVADTILNGKSGFEHISYEVLPKYAGDYIFVDEANGGTFDKNNSIWKSLKAVKKNQVHDLDITYFWPFDPIAIANQAEKYVEILTDLSQK
ncbi:ABC transporter substrate-binding protein [Bacillus altitudinis]|uniref:ABC transporter substrate-binding protein n=1 Tax=Bacillus pumilus TaxID=1408 RepID=UPI0025A2552C|nr:ABC transporter substrate-binding protein [Bacillus pumilus]MDM5319204.1 ABC transporter substrate-binding protein [Bacillus pumilus]MDR4994154.1 ABC transporter substrate-binding protein [Bacillus altitudinis]